MLSSGTCGGLQHDQIHCVDCHATKTMPTGAGTKGRSKGDGRIYWMNAHLFDLPRKTNSVFKNIEPGRAMPIPFTNACGECHDVDSP